MLVNFISCGFNSLYLLLSLIIIDDSSMNLLIASISFSFSSHLYFCVTSNFLILNWIDYYPMKLLCYFLKLLK